MSKPSSFQLLLVSVIGGLFQVGIPMSSWAGTLLGNGLVVCAGAGTTWLLWSLLGQQQFPLSGKKQIARNSKTAKTRIVTIIPTLLLTVVTGIWTYYGGLPALLLEHSSKMSSSPGTPLKIIGYERHPVEAGKLARVNLLMKNDSGETLKFKGYSRIFIALNTPNSVQQMKNLEDQFWVLMETQRNQEPPAPDLAAPPGTVIFTTTSGPAFTPEQADRLNKGEAATLFFMGTLILPGKEGKVTTIEHCGYFRSDPRVMFYCKDHNGPVFPK